MTSLNLETLAILDNMSKTKGVTGKQTFAAVGELIKLVEGKSDLVFASELTHDQILGAIDCCRSVTFMLQVLVLALIASHATVCPANHAEDN